MITVDQLATTDLRTINEIWLGESDGLCLWRGEQMFTHDMLSEGTHDQNTRRLVVKLDSLDDQAAIIRIETQVRALLRKMGMNGDFYPAQRVSTRT